MNIFLTPHLPINHQNIGYEFSDPLLLTEKGVISNFSRLGSGFVVKGKVIPFTKAKIFSNGYEMIRFFKDHGKFLKKFLGITATIDLDDHDMLADGFICFKKDNEFTAGIFVEFNRDVHDKIHTVLKD